MYELDISIFFSEDSCIFFLRKLEFNKADTKIRAYSDKFFICNLYASVKTIITNLNYHILHYSSWLTFLSIKIIKPQFFFVKFSRVSIWSAKWIGLFPIFFLRFCEFFTYGVTAKSVGQLIFTKMNKFYFPFRFSENIRRSLLERLPVVFWIFLSQYRFYCWVWFFICNCIRYKRVVQQRSINLSF